jgi:hypothetical protein
MSRCAIVVLVSVLAAACQRGPRTGNDADSTVIPADAPASSPAASGASGSAATPGGTSGPTASDRAPQAAAFREVTVPAGTTLELVLDTGVASDVSAVNDEVRAHLLDTVRVDGTDVLPQGTPVAGSVTAVERAGKVKGRAQLSVRFSTVEAHGDSYPLAASGVARTARATKGKDALTIGGGAAGGALVGGLVGGKKGAAIGSAVGGGTGTAVVLSTRGEEVRLARGAAVSVRLTEPLTVRVPVR